MIKDITLGQFFPGRSLLHKMDPRMKIVITVLFIAVIFIAKTLWSLLAISLFTVVFIILGRIPLRIIWRSIKPLWFIIIFTSLINVFFGREGSLLFEWYFIKIYSGGLLMALFISVRIILLIMATSVLLSYTTSPISVTDGIESLLMPLSKIKVPVHDFAMMLTIALRFIPILIEETDKIINAQKARGADFETGSLVKKAKALIPVFIPLFVSSIRHADDLATAMECRCYSGGKGRTRMNTLKMRYYDIIMLAVTLIFGAGVIIINIYAGGFGI